MDSMDLQRTLPGHLAHPIARAYEAESARDFGALMLYAGHRLLRWALACRDGWAASTVLQPRFGDLAEALLKPAADAGDKGPLSDAVAKALENEEAGKAINDLLAAAELFLTPEMTADDAEGLDALSLECARIVERLATALAPVFESSVVTGGPDRPDTAFPWTGPGGHGAFRLEHGLESSGTLLVGGDGKPPIPLGPASMDQPPLPLLAFPGPENGGWWETPCGSVRRDNGRLDTPLGELTPNKALGRLFLWLLDPDDNPTHAAERLADAGLPMAGAELMIASIAVNAGDMSPESLEEAVHFLGENDLTTDALNAFFLAEMETAEAALREADDLKGVSEVLLRRQQFETGAAKVLTLSRLANLFRDKLDDADAGFVCLLSAIEEAPDDGTVLDDLVEEARRSGKEAEAADRLKQLAGTNAGQVGLALVRAAADLYADAGTDPEKEAEALKAALESGPDDHDLLVRASEVAVKVSDDAWLEEVLRARIDAAPDNVARMEAVLALAVLLQDRLDRPMEAAELYRRAMVMDPNHKESFEALVAIELAAGKPEDAKKDCEDLLDRTFDPVMRAAVLRSYASLQMDVFKDEAAAAAALSEAFCLDSGDAAAAQLLGTLYEGLGEWGRLIGFLRRRTREDPDNAVVHLLKMAEISRRNLNDPEAALGFLTEAAALAPDDPGPRDAIRALHEELGLWAEVARDLETAVDAAQPDARTDILVRLGDTYLDRLSLRGRAKDAFWRAMDTAPQAVAADLARRLADLHREDGEDDKELDALKEAVKAAGDDDRAADIHAEMGRIALEPPADRAKAREHLEKAVALNPVHPEAVERLAVMLLEDDQAERVLPLVEPLAQVAAKADDPDEERRLRLLAAGAAMKCADLQAASSQYARAVELDPADYRSRVTLGWLLAKDGKDQEAVDLLSKVLDEAEEALTPMDRIEVLDTMAGCAARQGDHARALEMLDAAYRLKGLPDAEALRGLVDAARKAGDGKKTTAYLEELVAAQTKGPQRFADKVLLGDTLRGEMDDPAGAMHWYLEAAEEGVSPKAALHKALDAALAAGENEDAATILKRIIELEQDGAKRAQYHYALALHVMEHLKDSATARQHLWTSLEMDPDQEDAVKALENLLAADNDEEGLARLLQLLARHYRLSGQEDRLLQTLRRLAQGYDERLNNPILAAQTLEQLIKEAPGDVDATVRLAEVLTRAPGKEADALQAHRRVLELDPTHEASYRAIRDLCVVLGDEDGAWTAAAALKVLGSATEADAAAFEAGRQPALMLKRDSLPDGAFQKLIADPGADPGLARVLSILYDPLRAMLPWKQPKDLGLGDKDLLDMREKGTLQNMAAAASKVLGIPLPLLYRARGRKGLAKLAFNPPALAIGDDVVGGWRGKELRFGLGRALTTFASGFQLAGISEADTLRLFFLAALRIAFDDYPVPEDTKGVDEMARDLGKALAPEMRTEIHAILTMFRREQKPIDSEAFLRGVDLTASRAGLFLANDLYVAGGILSEDSLFLSDLEYGDRVTDLCAWTVSSRYAELRHKMLRTT
ncbi:MAG: hypothetical protein GXP54_02370 [Deltaproteobacteria bacterium]|nr:hypothetical protein [Deltaproteobacteria bacterium]